MGCCCHGEHEERWVTVPQGTPRTLGDGAMGDAQPSPAPPIVPPQPLTWPPRRRPRRPSHSRAAQGARARSHPAEAPRPSAPCPRRPRGAGGGEQPLTRSRKLPTAAARGRGSGPPMEPMSRCPSMPAGRLRRSGSSPAAPNALQDSASARSCDAPGEGGTDTGVTAAPGPPPHTEGEGVRVLGGRSPARASLSPRRQCREKPSAKPQARRRSAVSAGQARSSSASGRQPASPSGFRLRSSSSRLCRRQGPGLSTATQHRGCRDAPFPTPPPGPNLESDAGLGEVLQPPGAEPVAGEVEEDEAGQGAERGAELGAVPVGQPAAPQAQLPQGRLQLQRPQQRRELGGARGQAPGAERGALLLQLRRLQQQRLRLCGDRGDAGTGMGTRGQGWGRGDQDGDMGTGGGSWHGVWGLRSGPTLPGVGPRGAGAWDREVTWGVTRR